jgi:hypothetical protein
VAGVVAGSRAGWLVPADERGRVAFDPEERGFDEREQAVTATITSACAAVPADLVFRSGLAFPVVSHVGAGRWRVGVGESS